MICFDLDDTLYKERDYVLSAYKAVALHLGLGQEGVDVMWNAFLRKENPFDALEAWLGRSLDIAEVLEVYRTHFPDIHLAPEVEKLLVELKDSGETLAIVTDGRVITQTNKFLALKLNRFTSRDDFLISESVGSLKKSGVAFRMLEEKYQNESRFIYVGDNPEKDVEAPQKLGWLTGILLDNEGVNIHSQNFDEWIPNQVSDNLTTLVEGLLRQNVKS